MGGASFLQRNEGTTFATHLKKGHPPIHPLFHTTSKRGAGHFQKKDGAQLFTYPPHTPDEKGTFNRYVCPLHTT